jgi:hypothetical protein
LYEVLTLGSISAAGREGEEKTQGFWMDWAKSKKFLRGLWRVWRLLTTFVRWTAIVVFSVLFVAGLILRIPWKILVLLALIPTIGLFVPRKRQKWFWMALALLAIGVYVWIFLPDLSGTIWQTYQFKDEGDADFLSNPKNAAVQYMRFIDESENIVFSYPYSTAEDQITYSGPWEAQRFVNLSHWLDQRRGQMETLIEIAQMPLCQFEPPIDWHRYRFQQYRIKIMKAWASVLIRASHRDMAAGQLEEALKKQEAILGMARHLYAQGTLLDQAGGYYLEQAVARVLRGMIVEQRLQEPLLEQIDAAIRQTQSNWDRNWPLILAREKKLTKNMAAMFYQMDQKGQTRITRNLGKGAHEAIGYPQYRLFGSEKLTRLAVLAMWLSMPTTPQGIEAIIEARFDRYAKMAQAGEDLEFVDRRPIWLRGLNCRAAVDWYAKQQVSFYYPLKRKDLQHRALRRAMQILILIQKHRLREGQWPAQLEELLGPSLPVGQLIDPVSGQLFAYKRTGDGFCLYSVGPNKRDDQGVSHIKEDKDDRMYWPIERWEEDFDEKLAEEKILGYNTPENL